MKNELLKETCVHFFADNGGYSQWGNWTQCSVNCSFGLRSRSRSCTNPPPRPGGNNCSDLGSDTETGECYSEDCPGREMRTAPILAYLEKLLLKITLTLFRV